MHKSRLMGKGSVLARSLQEVRRVSWNLVHTAAFPLNRDGSLQMTDDPDKKERDAAVERLRAETGITEQQALDLVTLLGTSNWPSLVREAQAMKSRPQDSN